MSKRPTYLSGAPSLNKLIPGPVLETSLPLIKPPPGSVDCHAHIFGPSNRFPYAEGRGYTPPDAPLELFLKMDDAIGCDRAVVVQGNAHGFDNRAILDAVSREPDRLRGICITDTRVSPEDLRHWHTLGIRGLRFHLHVPHDRPAYVRGVGLDVLEVFKPVMIELGWHAQVWCAWPLMEELASPLRNLSRQMPVVIDHMLSIEASQGVNNPNFQILLKLLGEGCCWVKTSGAYRLSTKYPNYPDARPFHEALVKTNPEQLVWGTDWPHASMDAEMPDDGKLMDLFNLWTPDPRTREKILVRNPERLYGFARWSENKAVS